MADASVAPVTAPAAAPNLDLDADQQTQRRVQALACLKLGWKIEALAGICQLIDQTDVADESSMFPLDFLTTRTQQLQEVLQELASLAPDVPGPSGQTSTVPGIAGEMSALVETVQAWAQSHPLPDPGEVIAKIRALDAVVGVCLVGAEPDSIYETAYETGKALSLTYQEIAAARRGTGGQTPENSKIIAAWTRIFAAKRITAIRRHLQVLSPIFAPASTNMTGPLPGQVGQIARGMTAVSDSIEYWRQALAYLDGIKPASRSRFLKRRQKPTLSRTSASTGRSVSDDARIQANLSQQPELLEPLTAALAAQQTDWYDVLSGQRAVDTFCPLSIVVSLTEGVLGSAWSRAKHFVPLAVGLITLILIFGGLVGLGVLVLHRQPLGQDASAWTAVLTVLGAGITYVFALGARLYRQGQGAMRQVQVHAQEVVSSGEHTTRQVAQMTGQVGATAARLAQVALSSVAEQIAQVEYAVAVSQPLVGFVLHRAQVTRSDPLREATSFLRLIHPGFSNLEHLLALFPELYIATAVVG